MRSRFIPVQNALLKSPGQANRIIRGRSNTAALVVLLAFTLSACGARVQSEVSLPPTPVITVRPNWAVAITSYARIRDEPSQDARIVGHLRVGEVAAIVAIGTNPAVTGGERYTWYEVMSSDLRGWAIGSDLMLYQSESRARNAAERFLHTSNQTTWPGGEGEGR